MAAPPRRTEGTLDSSEGIPRSDRRDGRRETARSVVRAATPYLRAAAMALSLVVLLGVTARYTKVVDRYFIYFPDSEITQDPGDRGLEFEDVTFTASDGVALHGWFVPGGAQAATIWVWFHGNAGNISNRVDNLAEVHQRLGVSVFIFDYRGYGRSEGTASEEGTYLDAEAAVAYLRSRDDVDDVDDGRLVLFGRSLGCAVAAETALRTEVSALVLESGFTSIQAMAQRHYSYLPGIGRVVQTRYDCLAKVRDVRVPVMVLHGDRDDIVPHEMGRELFEAATEPKRFYTIEGAGHNDTYLAGGPAYYDALESFLEDFKDGG